MIHMMKLVVKTLQLINHFLIAKILKITRNITHNNNKIARIRLLKANNSHKEIIKKKIVRILINH